MTFELVEDFTATLCLCRLFVGCAKFWLHQGPAHAAKLWRSLSRFLERPMPRLWLLPKVPMRIVNSAISVRMNDKLEPRYFFGVSRAALENPAAFRNGWVYLLPGIDFEREPADESLGFAFESIHAYDEDELAAVAAGPDGFPWIKDPPRRSTIRSRPVADPAVAHTNDEFGSHHG